MGRHVELKGHGSKEFLEEIPAKREESRVWGLAHRKNVSNTLPSIVLENDLLQYRMKLYSPSIFVPRRKIDPPTQLHRILKTKSYNQHFTSQDTKILETLYMEIFPGRDLKFPSSLLIFAMFP